MSNLLRHRAGDTGEREPTMNYSQWLEVETDKYALWASNIGVYLLERKADKGRLLFQGDDCVIVEEQLAWAERPGAAAFDLDRFAEDYEVIEDWS
jgi:hypothetical protein